MVIVDSSVWIDLLNRNPTPQTDWLRREIAFGEVGLPSIVLVEVLQGIRFESRFRKAEQLLRSLTIFEGIPISVAAQSARNYRSLRALGFTVRSTVDCILATFCIESGHPLLHADADFDRFEQHLGLRVIHP